MVMYCEKVDSRLVSTATVKLSSFFWSNKVNRILPLGLQIAVKTGCELRVLRSETVWLFKKGSASAPEISNTVICSLGQGPDS